MNRLKILMVILFLSINVWAVEFETENYEFNVTTLCEEGNVTCDNIQIVGGEKSSVDSEIHIGNTVHSKCSDEITPCRFLGYEFKSNGFTYRLLESDSRFELINESGELVIQEQGKWLY